jgi:hypothetical protein
MTSSFVKKFIDLKNSPLYFTYEYPQVNPSPENLVARPASPLVKLYFPLRQHAHQSLDEAQLYWRTAHGPLIRSMAPAMAASGNLFKAANGTDLFHTKGNEGFLQFGGKETNCTTPDIGE